ncbi:MAG: VOC family protein [Bacteroidia bacterium]
MAIKINPYLGFDGNTREAMNFYKTCCGGELTLQTIAETPLAAQCPAGMQNDIIHSMLKNGDLVLMATDMKSPAGFSSGTDMSIAISSDDEEEIRTLFAKLKEGGEVIDELKSSFWGTLFGVVKDKFGKVWMLDGGKG